MQPLISKRLDSNALVSNVALPPGRGTLFDIQSEESTRTNMGKGKDLFGHYNDLAKQKGPGTEESEYAGVLFQALLMVGERKTFELLEEADEQGKKLKLEYPAGSKNGASPTGITLT